MLKQMQGAKNVMLQIICGKGFELMMSDMNRLAAFVEMLNKNVNCYWGIDNEQSDDFKLRIELYIIK